MSKIYTTLESPIELRKNLIKTNIKVIEMIEDLEEIKSLKCNKYNTYLYLKAYLKEINSNIMGLRSRFPHLEFNEEEKIKRESEKIDIEFEDYVKPDKEIDHLEKELFVLREKLKEIG